MMTFASAETALADLRQRVRGLATALLYRDGTVQFCDLPQGAHPETYAVMCAAIYGAAATANSELGRAPPDRIVIGGADSVTVILPSGTTKLLVAIVEAISEVGPVLSETAKFADYLKDF